MIFKHPALLYGLLFLLVPIIVHLFQLRRFTKVDFTNVAFLKPLISQTRKSRTIKKWLTLLARLAAVACIVIAFTQPFIPGSATATQEKESLIFIDNSYSMEATGSNGSLYNQAITGLVEQLDPEKIVTVFTNDQVYKDVTRQEIANQLLNKPYSSTVLDYEQVQLKANALFENKDELKELIMISDFQKSETTFPDTIVGLSRELLVVQPELRNNIAIDSAYFKTIDANGIELEVIVSSNYVIETPVTLSIDNNNILAAKTSVDLSEKVATATFNLPVTESLKGRIYLEDQGLKFDNELFVTAGTAQRIKVLAINNADADFLRRIYNEEEFEFKSVNARDLNFNLIKEQNLIILNEVNNIAPNLATQINNFLANGGTLLMIPALENDGYTGIASISKSPEVAETELKITQINFNHPLLKGVFNKQVQNFQYPKVNATSGAQVALNSILKYEDGTSFLYQNRSSYIFTAPLNTDNSNFTSSPLIVPVLYNIGKNSLPLPKMYYEIGKENAIAINTKVAADQVLSLQNKDINMIPRQNAYDSYVTVTTGSELAVPGHYEVLQNEELKTTLSFNVNRKENNLNYFSNADLGGKNISYTIEDLLYKLEQQERITSLWKYFVAGALLFLIIELLILKYVK